MKKYFKGHAVHCRVGYWLSERSSGHLLWRVKRVSLLIDLDLFPSS